MMFKLKKEKYFYLITLMGILVISSILILSLNLIKKENWKITNLKVLKLKIDENNLYNCEIGLNLKELNLKPDIKIEKIYSYPEKKFYFDLKKYPLLLDKKQEFLKLANYNNHCEWFSFPIIIKLPNISLWETFKIN